MVRNYVHIIDNIAKLRTFTRPPYGITDNYGTIDEMKMRDSMTSRALSCVFALFHRYHIYYIYIIDI